MLHYIQIYLGNLAKMRWKIEIYILTFLTQRKNYQKNKCSIQVDFTNDGTSNVAIQMTQKNYHYGFSFSKGVGN